MAIVQPLNLQPKPVPIHQWLKDRVGQFQDQANQIGVSLHWEVPDV